MNLYIEEEHQVLFNKILWFESLEEEIINLAEEEKLDIELLIKDINEKYGPKLPNLPLEELVDINDVDGWLQEKIISAEERTAAWITRIINNNSTAKSKLESLYKNQGKKAAEDLLEKCTELNTAIQIFNGIYEYILDGIPSEKVNEIISSSDNQIEWKRIICVHETIWNKENGDVNYFYYLRNKWIEEFVHNVNDEFEYIKYKDGIQSIVKKNM
ncbi:hypothetical protein FDA33_17875 [Clostridium botulinum]|uniref:Uncharacterized protein n=1 Tax=Clostridium botulinum TaxID=1491 RepID=A0A6B4P2T6_CLOBO|nr:hypothetical protein [Clostridium botulinum]MBY6915858.1 hypothetical protein [Clostridium botulinum]MCS6109525.1 hypothetical protein [Clostridium botulinum]NFE58375.1 hypothetical protein [Clostridium botulinum]NFF86723.1 hypothetical protein [Clostridium botulinum]NFH92027.1 hypothetical protein [Clostridium botulinum]